MPDKKALLIGVSHYGEGLVPIPSALRDVDALAELLRDPALGGFDAEAVRVLQDPARTEMEDAVEYLFRNSSADDLLLLYFSGHGLRNENRQLFLACRETGKIQEGHARGRLREATALSAGTLHRYMDLSPSKRQLVILDCCFSGAMAIGMTVKDDGRIDLYEVLGGEGRAVLTSSAATELSFAGATLEEEQAGVEQGLSVYTRFLLEGIRTGAADRDRRGFVDAEDLHDYVKRRLGEVNPAQTPEFYPTRTGYRIVVSRVPRDPTVEYRKQVQSLAEGRRGVISPAGRKVLDNMKHEVGLPEPEAEAIEAEVLQPFREYEDKLQSYRQALEKTVAALPQPDAPLSPLDWQDLALLESNLKLGEEDVLRLQKQLGIQYQSNMKTYPKSKAVLHLAAGPTGHYVQELGTDADLKMIRIESGIFLIGSARTESGHTAAEDWGDNIHIKEFYLSETLITQAQWHVVANLPKIKFSLNPNPSHFRGKDTHPVESINWYHAVEFCNRLSNATDCRYRLPREAEWEYACRAGSTYRFSFGDEITPDLANYDGTKLHPNSHLGRLRQQTTPVKEFTPNRWDLCDMHGNVWEWCSDDYQNNYSSITDYGNYPNSLSGTEFGVLRGGAWNSKPSALRSASRSSAIKDEMNDNIGFRVACSGRCVRNAWRVLSSNLQI